jgi:ribose transport system ATP-binding protein
VEIDGTALPFGSPDHAHRLGCRFVHQDLGLVATCTVLDNLAMGFGFPTSCGTIRKSVAVDRAREAMTKIGLEIDPLEQVANLGAAERTGVAIARALRDDPASPPRVLILDEPTATLPTDEVDHLLARLRTAASHGLGILYVTHHLQEVFRIADRVTVLRDGVIVQTSAIDSIDRSTLVEQLVGAEVDEVRRDESRPSIAAPPVLVIDNLQAGPVRDVSMCVKAGEIVGIAGLTGSGRESLLGVVFGAVPRESGQVEVDGRLVPAGRPDLAMSAGLGFLPADRKVHGGIMSMTAQENLTLTDLKPFWSGMRLHKKWEARETDTWFSRLQIRPSDGIRQPLATFSGGNQQKILFGKWLRQPLRAFLLDEPTQGVDVGAKAELHRCVLELAKDGTSVVVSSTDVDELVALCDRVLVIRDGRIADELAGSQVNASSVASRFMSEVPNEEAAP